MGVRKLRCGWGKQRDITPCCDKQQIEKKLRQEPPGVIWIGHLDAMAVRKMIKLFLACLWLVWREAEGLPTRSPYAIEKKGHSTMISPWEMVDKRATNMEETTEKERANGIEKPK